MCLFKIYCIDVNEGRRLIYEINESLFKEF